MQLGFGTAASHGTVGVCNRTRCSRRSVDGWLLCSRRSRVLLFGSRAREDSHEGSDVDVLVIEPTVDDPVQESVRLRSVLRGLGVPIDVVVFGQEEADRRATVRGTVVDRALREGRTLIDARGV